MEYAERLVEICGDGGRYVHDHEHGHGHEHGLFDVHQFHQFFAIMHALYIARKIKNSHNGHLYAVNSPLSSLFGFLFVNFAGPIVTSIVLGKKPLFLQENLPILASTVVWLLVFFSPTDIVGKIINLHPFQDIIAIVEGAHLSYKLSSAIDQSLQVYPHSYTSAFFIGWLNVCASLLFYYWESKLRTDHYNFPLDEPSRTAVVTLVCSFLYIVLVDPAHVFDDFTGIFEILHFSHETVSFYFILAFTADIWLSVTFPPAASATSHAAADHKPKSGKEKSH